MASSVACGLLIVLELIEALPRLSTTEYIVVSNGVLSGILYHFIQFVSHASRALKNRRNVTMVTVILAK